MYMDRPGELILIVMYMDRLGELIIILIVMYMDRPGELILYYTFKINKKDKLILVSVSEPQLI